MSHRESKETVWDPDQRLQAVKRSVSGPVWPLLVQCGGAVLIRTAAAADKGKVSTAARRVPITGLTLVHLLLQNYTNTATVICSAVPHAAPAASARTFKGQATAWLTYCVLMSAFCREAESLQSPSSHQRSKCGNLWLTKHLRPLWCLNHKLCDKAWTQLLTWTQRPSLVVTGFLETHSPELEN